MPSPCPQISFWLLFLPGILVVLFFLLFFYWFSKRKPPQADAQKSEIQEANANNTTEASPFLGYPIRVIVDRLPPAPPPSEAQKAKEYRAERREESKFFAEVIAAGFALALLAVTSIYVFYTYKMWCEVQEQTRIQRNAYIATQRPWIKIKELKTLGNNPPIPALSFQGFGYGPFPHGNKATTLQLKISLKNIGHSLAFVTADFEVFLPAWKNNFEDIILAEENRFCDASAKNPPNKYLTRVVFPEEPLEWDGAGVQNVGPLMLPGNTLNHIPEDAEGDYILPTVIVCTNYTFPSSPKIYQTRAMYIVVHQQTGIRFFKTGVDVPESGLRIIRDEMADNAY